VSCWSEILGTLAAAMRVLTKQAIITCTRIPSLRAPREDLSILDFRSMMSDIYIGKRLSYDGRLCTVRYHGEVLGTKGEWLGVEWDDPTRGKHAGEHQGTKYFTCEQTSSLVPLSSTLLPLVHSNTQLGHHPSSTPASFIRPTRKPDPANSFTQALKFKYASDPLSSNFQDPDVHIVFNTQPRDHAQTSNDPSIGRKQPIKFSGKVAEEVGFDKIRKQLSRLEELRIVILDGLCMCRPQVRGTAWMKGNGASDVKDACPKVTELDLSRNLFEEWREVADVCEQLQSLKILRIEYVCCDSAM
jgi:hypothetical protein